MAATYTVEDDGFIADFPKPGDDDYDSTDTNNPNTTLDPTSKNYDQAFAEKYTAGTTLDDGDLAAIQSKAEENEYGEYSSDTIDPKIFTASADVQKDLTKLTDEDKAALRSDYDREKDEGKDDVEEDRDGDRGADASFSADEKLTFARETTSYLGVDDKCQEGDDAQRGTLVKTVEYVKPFTILGEVVKEGTSQWIGDAEYTATAERQKSREYWEEKKKTWTEEQDTNYTQQGKLITQQQVIADKMYLDDRKIIDIDDIEVNPSDIKPVFPKAPTIEQNEWINIKDGAEKTNPTAYHHKEAAKMTSEKDECERTEIKKIDINWGEKKVYAPKDKIGIHYDKQVNTNGLKTMCADELKADDTFGKGFLEALASFKDDDGKSYSLDELLDPDCKFEKPTKVIDVAPDDCKVNVIAEQDFTLTWTETVTTEWEQVEWWKGTKTLTQYADYNKQDKYTKAATATRKAYFFQKGQETGKINTYIKQVGGFAKGQEGEHRSDYDEAEAKATGETKDGKWLKPTDWKLKTGGWKMKGNEVKDETTWKEETTRYVEHTIIEGDACFKTTLNKCPIMKIDVDVNCPDKKGLFDGKATIGKDQCVDSSCKLFDNDNHCPLGEPNCDGKGFDDATADDTVVPDFTPVDDAAAEAKCKLYMLDKTYVALANSKPEEALKFMFDKSSAAGYNYAGNSAHTLVNQLLTKGGGLTAQDVMRIMNTTSLDEATRVVGLYDGTVQQDVDGKIVYAAGDGDGQIDRDEYVNCGKSKDAAVPKNPRLDAETQEVDEAFGSEGEFSADEVEAVDEAVVAVEEAAAAEVIAA